MKFSTKAIHIGQDADPATGATIVPIYQTSTYTQEGIGEHKGFEYSRTGNPTRQALEICLASLENAKFGLAFASGMAATTTLLALFHAGDHIVAGNDLYGGTFRVFTKVFQNLGLRFTFVDSSDPNSIARALEEDTRLIWLETPSNPLLRLCDIRAIANIAKLRQILIAVDNTFVSPYFQQPLDLGADLVVHSTTKYISGHSDVVGGAILTRSEALYEQLAFLQNSLGGVPGPFDAWLTLRGLKTLALRMEKHQQNAMAVASFLASHPQIESVNYPGLSTHPQFDLAQRQMTGFGGMISFEVKGGLEAAKKLVTSTRLFALAESLGGVESLIGHPATMTHAAIPAEQRVAIGIHDGLIRISVGIEDVGDLIEDLQNAIGYVSK